MARLSSSPFSAGSGGGGSSQSSGRAAEEEETDTSRRRIGDVQQAGGGEQPPDDVPDDIQDAGPGAGADGGTETTEQLSEPPRGGLDPGAGGSQQSTPTGAGGGDRQPFAPYDETPADTNPIDRALGSFDERVSGIGKTLVDTAFQEPQELGFGEDTVTISGPSVGGRSGEQGTLDTDITDALTEGRGLITDEKEQNLREKIQRRRDLLTPIIPGTEAGEFVTDVTGSERAGAVTEGLATIPVDLTSSGGAGILLGADLATEAAANAPEVVDEYGAGETALTVLEAGGRVTGQVAQSAQENPYRTGGEVVGGFLTGAAAFKGIEKAGDIGRSGRLSTSRTVDYEDITTKRGAEGELPRFDTAPDAETGAAVAEVRRRAADNPDVVTEQTGGETLFHGTQADFGADIDVGEGASELPGLFTSPEASPIALQGIRTSLTRPSIKPRLPDVSGKSDRFVGLPGDRIDAIPEGRAGAAYELRDVDTGEQVTGGLGRGAAKSRAADNPDVEVAPDQTTTGYEFLTGEADPGTAYVRPSGQRTTELESVFGPGSQFTKTGQIGVRVGRRQIPGTDIDIPGTGRTVPLDTYRRPDSDVDVDVDADAGANLPESVGGDTVDYGELTSELERLSRRQAGSLTAGGGVAGLGATGATGVAGTDITPTGTGGGGEVTPTSLSDTGFGTDTSTGPTGPTDTTDMTGPTDTSPPSGTGGPTDTTPPTSPPGTTEPSSPTDTTPTSPPGSTSTPPTSGTPTTPPTSGTPTSPPTDVPPTSTPPTSGAPTSIPPTSGTPTPPDPPLDLDFDDDDERRFPDLPTGTEQERSFEYSAATPEEVLDFSFDDSSK